MYVCSLFLFATGVWAEIPLLKSTADDQNAMEITVYNSNIGLVKDTRTVSLHAGMGELRFMDVAAHIMPVTVHVSSAGTPQALRILEQNYEYDLMNGRKLLDKYVGKQIKIVDWNRYQDRKDVVEATLLSNNEDEIYRIDGEIYIGHPGIKVLPEIPENLIAKPTLTWLFESRSATPQQIEVSYLTGNIDWKADYVMVLDKDDISSELAGWVTIDNKSGATYRDAKLKLIAGEVNRVKAPQAGHGRKKRTAGRQSGASVRRTALFRISYLRSPAANHHQEQPDEADQSFGGCPCGSDKDLQRVWYEGIFHPPLCRQEAYTAGGGSYLLHECRGKQFGRAASGRRRFASTKRMPPEASSSSARDSIIHTPKDETVTLKVGEGL